jgi:hypothetical protein
MKETYKGYKKGDKVILKVPYTYEKNIPAGTVVTIEGFPPKVRLIDKSDVDSKGHLHEYFILAHTAEGDTVRMLLSEVEKIKKSVTTPWENAENGPVQIPVGKLVVINPNTFKWADEESNK